MSAVMASTPLYGVDESIDVADLDDIETPEQLVYTVIGWSRVRQVHSGKRKHANWCPMGSPSDTNSIELAGDDDDEDAELIEYITSMGWAHPDASGGRGSDEDEDEDDEEDKDDEDNEEDEDDEDGRGARRMLELWFPSVLSPARDGRSLGYGPAVTYFGPLSIFTTRTAALRRASDMLETLNEEKQQIHNFFDRLVNKNNE